MDGWRARIGVLYPASGYLDSEFYRLAPAGVSVHIQRVSSRNDVSIDDVRAMGSAENLSRFAKELAFLRLDCLTWACTSGSFGLGKEGSKQQVAALAQSISTSASNTSEAMVRAFKHLGISKVGLATPYADAFNAPIVDFVEAHGFKAVSIVNLGLSTEYEIASQSPETVYRLVKRAAVPEAEAVFVSCTGLPALDLITVLEEDLRRPVLTANQVTMWDALRLCHIGTRSLEHFGSLFARQDSPNVI
jgi:maleate cis-trans isomerase